MNINLNTHSCRLIDISFKRILYLSKEGFWIISGQTISVIGSLIGIRYLTKLLSPADYGKLTLGLTVATLVSQTVMGPLSNGITRFYSPAQEQNDLAGYISSIKRLIIYASLFVIILMMITIVVLLLIKKNILLDIVIAAFMFAILSGYNSIFNAIQNAARQRATVALHQGLDSWARILIAVFMLTWLSASSTIAIIGYIIAIIFLIISQYIFFKINIAKHLVKINEMYNWRKQIWSYSWPFATWGIFTWAQLSSDRWSLELFTTTQEVGRFAVLFQLGYNPIAMITGMTTQLLEPILFQQAGSACDRRRNDVVNKLSWRLTLCELAITTAAFIVATFYHKNIFEFFVSDEYLSVSYLLPWVILSGGIFAAGQTIALNLMSQMKTHSMVFAKIITACLGVIFNFIGAYFCGITGIVVSGILFSICYFLWMKILTSNLNENYLIM